VRRLEKKEMAAEAFACGYLSVCPDGERPACVACEWTPLPDNVIFLRWNHTGLRENGFHRADHRTCLAVCLSWPFMGRSLRGPDEHPSGRAWSWVRRWAR
jgi:hypothetical protein